MPLLKKAFFLGEGTLGGSTLTSHEWGTAPASDIGSSWPKFVDPFDDESPVSE